MDELLEAMARVLAVAEARRRFKWTPEGKILDEMVPGFLPAGRAALSAISAAGWAVVPKEPTAEMLHEAGIEVRKPAMTIEPSRGRGDIDVAYRAMLAAAPKVPS